MICIVIIAITGSYIASDIATRAQAMKEIATIQQFKETEQTQQAQSPEQVFDSLKAINSDYIFWMTIENTNIDLPVVKGKNNSDYLHLTIYKKRNNAGTLFLDCQNDAALTDQNTVIYGHSRYDGTMFSQLSGYKNQAFYESHPLITIATRDKVYYYQVFSCNIVSADFDYRSSDYGKDFMSFVSKMRSDSFLDSAAKVDSSSRILTLSTCGTGNKAKRTAVLCVLLNPEGEDIDTNALQI
jgi:sortase B